MVKTEITRSSIVLPGRAAWFITLSLGLAPVPASAATRSFEFVVEHLPEVAMDNRFATLPLASGDTSQAQSWQFTAQAGVARTGSGGLKLAGPMWSAALRKQLNDQWSVHAFGFIDSLKFSGGDRRPLATLFTATPLVLPAEALFTDLHGRYRNIGAGIGFSLKKDEGWLGEHEWVIGALIQRVELRDYRATYRVLDGPSSGTGGFADYSGDYAQLTPFAGLALPRNAGAWRLSPHALMAIPIPRRGVRGRIAGPGFDLSGDTAKAGNGKHFGDISVTMGLDVTYKPWDLTLDIGSVVSQALLERFIHKGIDRNWLISAYKRF